MDLNDADVPRKKLSTGKAQDRHQLSVCLTDWPTTDYNELCIAFHLLAYLAFGW